nr:atherin-like [Aegilops tauschii subsp. strangulata]
MAVGHLTACAAASHPVVPSRRARRDAARCCPHCCCCCVQIPPRRPHEPRRSRPCPVTAARTRHVVPASRPHTAARSALMRVLTQPRAALLAPHLLLPDAATGARGRALYPATARPPELCRSGRPCTRLLFQAPRRPALQLRPPRRAWPPACAPLRRCLPPAPPRAAVPIAARARPPLGSPHAPAPTTRFVH